MESVIINSERLHTLTLCGVAIVIFYFAAFFLIFADLWAGVRKAKERGEMRTSEAYKRTVDKINKYFNLLLALTVVDIMQITVLFFLFQEYAYDIVMFPFFTFLGCVYVAFIEVKSISEPADIKERKQQQDFKKLIVALLKDESIKDKLIKILKDKGEIK